jgi:hypothetical protein
MMLVERMEVTSRVEEMRRRAVRDLELFLSFRLAQDRRKYPGDRLDRTDEREAAAEACMGRWPVLR